MLHTAVWYTNVFGLFWYIKIQPKAPAKRSQHVTQHIATLLGATCCARLAILWPNRFFGQADCWCCDMMGHIGCCWLKFENGQVFHATFVDVVCLLVWPGSCNNVAPGHAHYFDVQYPTCRNTLQQGSQTRATCCAQQCCGMLRSNVAIDWPGLENAGPTMLGYVEMLRSFGRGLTQ